MSYVHVSHTSSWESCNIFYRLLKSKAKLLKLINIYLQSGGETLRSPVFPNALFLWALFCPPVEIFPYLYPNLKKKKKGSSQGRHSLSPIMPSHPFLKTVIVNRWHHCSLAIKAAKVYFNQRLATEFSRTSEYYNFKRLELLLGKSSLT